MASLHTVDNPASVTLNLRWFGIHDPVQLAAIRQIPGVTGVVSSVTGVPAGQPWSTGQVSELRERADEAGLRLEVIESIPVSDAIKLADAQAEAHIDAWCASVQAVGEAGVGVVCYNFMPVADWIRTDLAFELPDGSTTLAFMNEQLPTFEQRVRSGAAGEIPAWDHVDFAAFDGLRERYAVRGETGLWDALGAFLERVVPVAEAAGVRLALHPDDPCWPVLGLPRIVTSGSACERVCELVPSRANAITFCTGSLGCDPANDLVDAARRLGERVAFLHARNIRTTAPHSFIETAHPRVAGDLDLPAIIRALVENGFAGPVRPDHGRMIWGERGNPGYGLYDRALGATYLRGVFDTLDVANL
jgi:mannonate dehydratase